MAKARFKGFSVKKHGSRGLTARNQGLKHNYTYKQRGLYAKSDEKGLW
jgi:hypothetical protein